MEGYAANAYQNQTPAVNQNGNAGADQNQNAAPAQQPAVSMQTLLRSTWRRQSGSHYYAGLSADAVKHMDAYLEYDDGMEQYEVQFYEGTTEYEYSIDAVNGTVLGYNMESIFS